jgi:phage terminase large subunit-like protein
MVAGLRDNAPFQRAYLERPRGHSKTTDIGSMALEILYLSPLMLEGVAAADDRDQARLIRNAIKGMVRTNPWLAEYISVQDYRVVNKVTGSALEIISNDAGSSYGFTPHFIIVDELTHWKKQDLWISLFSSSAKRANCMLVIIANAGFGQGLSWQWELRESCRKSEKWYFSSLQGPQASWQTESNLAEQRELLSHLDYKRLWLNEWVRETGEGLDWDDIKAAVTLNGPQPFQNGLIHLACLDIGIRNDHSALVILAIDDANERYRVCQVVSWKPEDYGGQVKLSQVEADIVRMMGQYKLRAFIYDRYEAVRIVEELSRHDPDMELFEVKFSGESQLEMAEGLLQVFRRRQIDMFEDKDLMEDLLRIQIEHKTVGYKVTARRDEKGHADRAFALAMMLPTAIKVMHDLREPDIDDGLGDSVL